MSRRTRVLSATVAMVAFLLAGCASLPLASSRDPAGTQPADRQLRDVLATLNKMHGDRMKLSAYASIPFIHKIDKDVRAFTDWLGEQNSSMQTDLAAYARKKGINLRYEVTPELFSQAQALMEKTQGDQLMNSGDGFSQFIVIFEFIDNGWGQSLVQTTLDQSKIADPELKELLQRELKLHQESIAKLMVLLKKFKPAAK